jgi:hypothetical protein
MEGFVMMKRYPLQDLIKRWEREDLTAEQAIGQIMLWLDFLSQRVAKLERNLAKSQLRKSSE